MHYRDKLPNRAMHAPDKGEAVMSRMHFAQFVFHGSRYRNRLPGHWTEFRRPKNLAASFVMLIFVYRALRARVFQLCLIKIR